MIPLIAALVIAGALQTRCDLRHIGACEDAHQLVGSSEFQQAFIRFAKPRAGARISGDAAQVWMDVVSEFPAFSEHSARLRDGSWLIHGKDAYDWSRGAFLISPDGDIAGFAALSIQGDESPERWDLDLFVRRSDHADSSLKLLREWSNSALADRIRQRPIEGYSPRIVGPLRATRVHYVAD